VRRPQVRCESDILASRTLFGNRVHAAPRRRLREAPSGRRRHRRARVISRTRVPCRATLHRPWAWPLRSDAMSLSIFGAAREPLRWSDGHFRYAASGLSIRESSCDASSAISVAPCLSKWALSPLNVRAAAAVCPIML